MWNGMILLRIILALFIITHESDHKDFTLFLKWLSNVAQNVSKS